MAYSCHRELVYHAKPSGSQCRCPASPSSPGYMVGRHTQDKVCVCYSLQKRAKKPESSRIRRSQRIRPRPVIDWPEIRVRRSRHPYPAIQGPRTPLALFESPARPLRAFEPRKLSGGLQESRRRVRLVRADVVVSKPERTLAHAKQRPPWWRSSSKFDEMARVPPSGHTIIAEYPKRPEA